MVTKMRCKEKYKEEIILVIRDSFLKIFMMVKGICNYATIHKLKVFTKKENQKGLQKFNLKMEMK